MSYGYKRILHAWEWEFMHVFVCEGVSDGYKQPPINPGAYSQQSYGHKFQGRIKGMCIHDSKIDFI